MKRGIFSVLREMPEQSCYLSCASTRDRDTRPFSSFITRYCRTEDRPRCEYSKCAKYLGSFLRRDLHLAAMRFIIMIWHTATSRDVQERLVFLFSHISLTCLMYITSFLYQKLNILRSGNRLTSAKLLREYYEVITREICRVIPMHAMHASFNIITSLLPSITLHYYYELY